MRALVTGATGKVGWAVAHALVARGDQVAVLARDTAKAAELLPAGVAAIRGDVSDPHSVRAAVDGCEVVFNAMGLPEQWLADSGDFDRVNAHGTETVVRAARDARVPRVVHTSTIDVFHAQRGERFDESELASYPKGTAYERSKQLAEELALAARGGGTEVVIVNPAGVYGPGPAASASLQEGLIEPVVRRRLPALPPGGLGIAFSPALAQGQLLAAELGDDGERYILSDRHISLAELARAAVRIAGRGFVPPTLPVALAKALATAGEALARATHTAPLLARGQLDFFLWNAMPDSTKAQERLGWEPMALDEGLRATLQASG